MNFLRLITFRKSAGGSIPLTLDYLIVAGGGGGAGGFGSAVNGTANTGGGGGGIWNATAANGGSGTIILRLPSSFSATFSGGVTSSLDTSVPGYNIYSVTATATNSETVTFS